MEKDKMCGAAVERGRITEVTETGSGTAYTVESIDRPGAVTLTIPAMGDRLAAGDVVYFSLFPDGTGIILSGLAGKIVKATATQTEDGLMSAADKTKLDTVEPGGEPNQNAFSNVKVGSTTIAAQTETDTVELAAGDNVTLTPDAAGKKVTVEATDTTYSDATQSAAGLMSAADKTELDAFAAYGVRAKTTTVTNIDNILDAGVYWLASNVQVNGAWPVDISVGTRYAILEVIVGGGSGLVKIQRMTVYSTGIVYERIYANSQWYAWNCDASLTYGYTIGANSNLNDYTDIGNFRVTQASVAATITNAPITNHGFLLKVMAGAMADVTIQLAISGVGDTIHMRYKTGSVWTAWVNYLTNNATTSASGYMSSTDKGVLDTSAVRGSKSAPSGSTSLDQFTTSGIYWLASSNYPNGWPSQEGTGGKNALLVVFYDGGGARVQELTMYDGNGLNRRYCRMYINSQWYAWRQIMTGAETGWSLDIGLQIAANTNLNNLRTPRNYTSPTNITPTLTNAPPVSSNAFILKVMVGHVANTFIQYAIDVTGAQIYIRYYNTSSWGKWYRYSGTAIS